VVVVRKGKEEKLTVKLGRLEDGEKQAALTTKKDTHGRKDGREESARPRFANLTAELRKKHKIKDR